MTHAEDLRDRYFAAREGRLDDAQSQRFHEEVDALDAPPVEVVQGLALSFHPTARFKTLRFVEAALIAEAHRAQFARPIAEAPELAAVFVDPQELHFRTFENIIPLDRLFETLALDLSLDACKTLDAKAKVRTLSLRASEPLHARLMQLDALGLYLPPTNAGSRGGERFIFHAAPLAEALTKAMREALPASVLRGFHHVNPVFRCNRFEPGDAPFRSHHDTPYRDAARNQISRYTLLIYLTGGRGAPALRVEDLALPSLAPMTCVLFDQRYEHAGSPYLDGRKVFLRTELIFEEPLNANDPRIAQLFSTACYMTGQSVFAPELESYAHDCYERVAQAHWEGLGADADPEEPFVHKVFRGAHFVANGYDFWFRKGALSLEACAALTLLDYFNCRVSDEAFRAQCETAVVRRRGRRWIPEFLAQFDAPGEAVFGALDKEALFPPTEADHPEQCCEEHWSNEFDATRNMEVIDAYLDAQDSAQKAIDAAPIVMMGDELFLDPARFVVRDGQIHVLSQKALAPVNFASNECWNGTMQPGDYIVDSLWLEAPSPLVPPILFTEHDGCYHLMLDFFRNGWMATWDSETVSVPEIKLK